jgi:hypothetical protein
MKHLSLMAGLGAFVLLSLPAHTAFAQAAGARGAAGRATGGATEAPKVTVAQPVPRWPDGHPYIGPVQGGKGTWFYLGNDGMLLTGKELRPTAPSIPGESIKRPSPDEVPFRPWARALFDYRKQTMLEPYTRCHPGAGARMPGTAYGTVLEEFPDLKRFFVMQTGGPHSFRTIFMDGRPHPKKLSPSYFGHAVGHWEGDTLVVDSVGFNERMWIEWTGMPTTDKLHLIERITRISDEWIRWEFTIDDLGAYTRPWSSGYYLRFHPGDESFEFVCQDNDQDELTVGDEKRADDNATLFVP